MIQNKIFSDSFGMLLQFVYVNMLFIVGNSDYCYALTYHAFYMLMIQNKIFSDSFGMLLQFVYVNMLFIVGNCDYCYALTYHAFYMLYHYM